MLARTPVEVMTEFFDTFLTHDKLDALAVLDGVPTIVMCGEADMVTPVKNSRAIAEALPSAELRELPGIGHMVMLEAAEQVNEAVRDLVAIAAASAEPRKLRRRAR
jgi:pimeloyl-ACP methyl ester carboxylesterase